MVHRDAGGSAEGVGARGAEWDEVERLALAMQGVTVGTKYDGSPVFQLAGVFVAGLAMHPSAESATLVVRCD